MERKKILLLTLHLPYPTNHGASLFNTFRLAEYLNKKHDLFFATFLKWGSEEYEQEFLKASGIKNYYFEKLDVPRTPVNLIKSYLANQTLNMFRSYSKTFADKIASVAHDYDVIVVDHYEAYQYIPKDYKGKKILRVHNAEYIMWERFAEITTNPIKKLVINMEAKRIKSKERQFCADAHVVLGAENDNINLEPNAKIRAEKYVEWLHLGDDEQINFPVPEYDQLENALLYVGTLSWEPNIDGLVWFVKEAWNDLKERHPDLKLYVIGRTPDDRIMELVNNYKDVISTGFVEDLEDYFTRCKINVIPLRFGSGIKVKTINGLCRGIPIVTTQVGAEGLHLENGKELYISDEIEGFKDYLSKLLTDKVAWKQLSDNSRVTAADRFTWKALFEILDSVL